jgi:heat shock protein 5
MRNTIEDKDKLATKLSEEDKNTISEALTETQDWINSNDDADKDALTEQLKDLQRVCDPIIAKIYQNQGGQGAAGDDEEFEDL